MTICILTDYLHPELSAPEAAALIEKTIRRLKPSATLQTIPFTEGAGAAEALAASMKTMQFYPYTAEDAFGCAKDSGWYMDENRRAYIDADELLSYQAADGRKRSVMETSSFGLGLLIAAAASHASEVIVFASRPAAADLGTGMAAALGAELVTESGSVIHYPKTKDISSVAAIHPMAGHGPAVQFWTPDAPPLSGNRGTAWRICRAFGESDSVISFLESQLSAAAEKFPGARLPDAGAASGIGAVFPLIEAERRETLPAVDELLGLDRRLSEAELVVTGQHQHDPEDPTSGVVDYVTTLCRKHNVRSTILEPPTGPWEPEEAENVMYSRLQSFFTPDK
ncbi:glycerate kinase [Alkalicoccus urumqiensis]|uniref:Glycerate kinase n=1 Tax=Alkalicoccus urumqiensis TaxID=1548213 RepID=A0A2P6ML89_ALKUR|nr:glycerate kinase [Alkalicoccus urumqiensis]PRO67033.1 hypothetical protein C6I21_00255 [Alkalicoccus urumqiensis]